VTDKPTSTREHQLVLVPSGRRGLIAEGTDLLTACRSLGVDLESICGGKQTCGKCQIVVEEGRYEKHGLTSAARHLSPPEAQEIACAAKFDIHGRRLACAARVQGELLVSVPEESQARKQVIAKEATERTITIQPAVRLVYIEVTPASLGDHRGDWQRVVQALREQWQIASPVLDTAVLPSLQPALRRGGSTLTLTLWDEREVLRIEPGYVERLVGLAVDVGSTTIAAHLCDLRTGAVLASESMMNPQVRFGEDLMSRVSYGMSEPQGVARMHRAVIRAINELAEKAAARAGFTSGEIVDSVLVGNSIMHHLLLGLDPVELGGAPFALATSGPLDVKARDLGLAFHRGARVHVLPCIAGHVGADHVAALLAEAPHKQDEVMLLIDVGTNAEISLGNRARMMCASSPTGPAFEGAQITHGQRAAPGAIERVRIDRATLEPRFKVIGHEAWVEPQAADEVPAQARATGICGSGIIEAVAEMFLAGIITSDGRFDEQAAERSPRVQFEGRTGRYVLADAAQTATGAPIVVTQSDVRAIQLAKAALYAGVRLLMEHQGVAHVDRIALAGAFGSYISPRHAMILGMIPDCELERVQAVGNSAGDGARIALLDREQRAEAERLAGWVEHVQTATEPTFQDQFVAALALPHASDAFPHLQAELPAPRTAARPRPRLSHTNPSHLEIAE
jgi:uncharacterized 2Fe-2S/4Fe-4S cluster protein (DUF4445 family)